MQWMQKVLQSEKAASVGGAGDVYAVTRGAGGTSQVALMLQEIGSLLRSTLADPNKFADVIFNPDTVNSMVAAKNTPTVQKLAKTIVNLEKALGVSAIKAGPRMALDKPLVEGEQNPANRLDVPMNFSSEEIEAELKKRGL